MWSGFFFFSFSWLFCVCPFLEGYPQGSSQEVRNDARFFSKRGNLIKGIDYTDEVREKIRDNEVTQKHITECFISLFLHNKVPQTFVAQNNNNHFFFIVIFRSFGIGGSKLHLLLVSETRQTVSCQSLLAFLLEKCPKRNLFIFIDDMSSYFSEPWFLTSLSLNIYWGSCDEKCLQGAKDHRFIYPLYLKYSSIDDRPLYKNEIHIYGGATEIG